MLNFIICIEIVEFNVKYVNRRFHAALSGHGGSIRASSLGEGNYQISYISSHTNNCHVGVGSIAHFLRYSSQHITS